jgi:hypothetical protein
VAVDVSDVNNTFDAVVDVVALPVNPPEKAPIKFGHANTDVDGL